VESSLQRLDLSHALDCGASEGLPCSHPKLAIEIVTDITLRRAWE